jgi:hypothetical protein
MAINGGVFTQDFRTQLRKYSDGATRIGDEGRLWYNNADQTLRISDGETSGGVVISTGGNITSNITVQDEGTALSTAATVLNFVGPGVVATGGGATKTITILSASGLSISDGSATDTVTVGTDTLTFSPVSNETTVAVTNNTVTIGLPNDVSITGDLSVGDDLTLGTLGSVVNFGVDSEVKLTHVHDKGLLLTDTGGNIPTLQFVDANESISSNGTNLIITSGGTAFTIPTSDGSADQVLKTDGSGNLSFATVSGGGAPALKDLSAGVIDTSNDSIAFIDANDSNSSKQESVTDFLSAIAGSGISVSSGQLTASGGGGSSITVQDEGSSLSTAATTINFVGSGVVATGTGATKTVTIAGGSGSVDFSAVGESIIPSQNEAFDIGSSSRRWRDIFLSGDTIDLAGSTISADGTGTISISAGGVTLPNNSQVVSGNKLAITSESGGVGQAIVLVDFFSAAGGLSTANTTFEFNGTVENRPVFQGSKTFTFSNGSAFANAEITLFQF